MLGSSEIRPTAPDFTAAPTPGAPATTKSSLLSVPREQSSTSRSASATGRSWPRPVASLLCRHRHLRLHRYCHRHHHHRYPEVGTTLWSSLPHSASNALRRDFSNTTLTAPVSGCAVLRPLAPPWRPRSSDALSASSTTTLSAGASVRNRQLPATRCLMWRGWL